MGDDMLRIIVVHGEKTCIVTTNADTTPEGLEFALCRSFGCLPDFSLAHRDDSGAKTKTTCQGALMHAQSNPTRAFFRLTHSKPRQLRCYDLHHTRLLLSVTLLAACGMLMLLAMRTSTQIPILRTGFVRSKASKLYFWLALWLGSHLEQGTHYL